MKKPESILEWTKIRVLYLTAFPAAERKPFSIIRKMYRQGKADVWCILRSGKFAGFAATVNGDDLILLDYLAVSREYRGMGVGSKALALLMEAYSGQGVFVEIESTRCAGVEQEKRKEERIKANLAKETKTKE